MKRVLLLALAPVCLCGCTLNKYDVNGDGEINVKDLLLIQRYILGAHDVTLEKADLNGDGEVNDSDVQMLKQYLLDH